jgi:hypothetical protein
VLGRRGGEAPSTAADREEKRSGFGCGGCAASNNTFLEFIIKNCPASVKKKKAGSKTAWSVFYLDKKGAFQLHSTNGIRSRRERRRKTLRL